MKSIVAIVGRPNVGKSTLFNRLAGKRIALVEDIPGVTRDRHYAEAEWNGRPYTLIDTGGFVPEDSDSLLQAVRAQAELAVEECDAIIFTVDGRAGLTAADEAMAQLLRRTKKPVVVAVNKIDTTKHEEKTYYTEFFRLGFEDTVSISAEHGRGIEEMMGLLTKRLPAPEVAEDEPDPSEEPAEEIEEEEVEQKRRRRGPPEDGSIRVAICGRPNVGKSTLVNALLKKERMVASPVPGTTTDPVDSELLWQDRRIVLTDTAGIRRKKNIAQKIEQFSVVAALRTIEKSHVAVLLIDATEPAVDQDERIAGIAEEKGRALIIVVNKWDLVQRKPGDEEEGRAWVKQRFPFAAYAPVVFASALKRSRVEKVLELSAQLYDQFYLRAPTPQLNRLLEGIQESHPAPMSKGRRIRLYYIAQVSSAPPTFAIICSQPESVPADYKRYLVNEIRNAFNLRVPIRVLFRERPGQAKRAARKRPEKVKRRRRED